MRKCNPANDPAAPVSADQQIDAILDDLSSFTTAEQIIAQRQHPRIAFHQTVELICEGKDECGGVRLLATARDLSDGGIGLAGPCEILTPLTCQVTMVDESGCPMRIAGRILSCCEHLPGAWIYGVQFNRPIQAERFVGMRKAS